MSVYAVPNDKPFIVNVSKVKCKKLQVNKRRDLADRHRPPFYKKLRKTLQNADIFENKKRDFVVKHDLENRDLCKRR